MLEKDVFNLVIEKICNVLPELESHDFKYDDQLVNLGANSVDRAEIVTLCMEALSLNFPRVELAKVKNIGDLAMFLHEKVNRQETSAELN